MGLGTMGSRFRSVQVWSKQSLPPLSLPPSLRGISVLDQKCYITRRTVDGRAGTHLLRSNRELCLDFDILVICLVTFVFVN